MANLSLYPSTTPGTSWLSNLLDSLRTNSTRLGLMQQPGGLGATNPNVLGAMSGSMGATPGLRAWLGGYGNNQGIPATFNPNATSALDLQGNPISPSTDPSLIPSTPSGLDAEGGGSVPLTAGQTGTGTGLSQRSKGGGSQPAQTPMAEAPNFLLGNGQQGGASIFPTLVQMLMQQRGRR